MSHNFNLSEPILATLLENRTTSLVVVGAAILHTVLMILGLPSWQCPVRYVLGIPCPGCGLSRAATALLQGNWQTSLTYHVFGPFFLAALALMAGITLLPSRQRYSVINWIDRVERRTRITAILLIAFVVYWLARLLFFRETFVNSIMG